MARPGPSNRNRLLRAALEKFLKPARRQGRRNGPSNPSPRAATRNPAPAENVRNYPPGSRMTTRPYRGGSYSDLQVRNPSTGNMGSPPGGQINHIPPTQVMRGARSHGWSTENGGAIQMDTLDHRMVHSTGSKQNTKDHRLHQQELINNGQMRDAIALDILDIRARFGAKYDSAINEMIDRCYPDYQDLKTISPNWTSQG